MTMEDVRHMEEQAKNELERVCVMCVHIVLCDRVRFFFFFLGGGGGGGGKRGLWA